MAGIGAITLDAAGSVTAPASLPLTLPSAESTRVNQHALKSMALMPAERGVMWADGIDPLRHYVTSVLGTGLLAPSTAPTATPSGAKASCRWDINHGGAGGTIANGDRIQLVSVGAYIDFVTSLSASPTFDQCLVGANDGATLTNLQKLINGTGSDGVEYAYSSGSNVWEAYITVSSVTTTGGSEEATFTAKNYGTSGNSYLCSSIVDGSGLTRWETAGGAATSVFAGGTAGTGTAPGAGTYQYAYAFVREDDGAVSGLSPTVEASTAEAMNIAIAAMTASADATVDYNRYYRTTAGGGRFYRVDEVAAATTTATDSFTDDTITNFGAVAYDERLSRSYRAGLPPKGRYLATYRGRYFTGGALLSANYTSGTASVNADATTVTVSGGYPRTAWIGRQVQFTTSETYSIMSVSESAGTFVIDRGLEGGANLSGVAYTVRDTRDPYELFWSEPGLPNNWPVVNSLKGVYSKDGKGITGLYAAFESLIIFTRQAVWRLTGYDNTSFQLQLVTDKCGCVSGHTVVMDGERMYWLGQDGVYGWAGSGDPVRISSPQSPDGDARGIDDTMSRLSLAYAHRATALYDEYDKEIRFHVPLDGEPTNRYSLVLSLQTGTWSLDTCEDYTWECIIQGPDGEDVSVAGDAFGCIWQTAISNSDGAYGFEPVQSVSSATVRTATVSGTPFPTASGGLAGCPVWQVTSGGVWARNRVASNTSSVLTYCRFQTAQVAATQMAVGGILMWLQTGRFDLGERRLKKILPGMTVAHSPDSDGQYFFFFASDQGDFAIPTRGWTAGDLTETKARRRFIVAKDAMLHGWGLCAVEPGCDPAFAAVTIEARARQDLDL